MKRKRYTAEQIVYTLKQADSGVKVADLSLDKRILKEVVAKKL